MPLSDHTPDSIAAMDAGPELDALTAEALGVRRVSITISDDLVSTDYMIGRDLVWRVSTDPLALHLHADFAPSRDWRCTGIVIERGKAAVGQLWNCEEDWGASVWGESVCYARTAHRDPKVAVCRAVCLAAMAHMTDEPEKESPNGEA